MLGKEKSSKKFMGVLKEMKKQETNIFLIENLEDLNCNFNLYKVRGLHPKSEDYHKNKQLLINILRSKTHTPIQPYKSDKGFLIAQLAGYKDLPESETLVRDFVKIEKLDIRNEFRFDSLTAETAPLAKKFLEWEMQHKFYSNNALWQPSPGFPYYNKNPDISISKKSKKVDVYNGFTSRVILLQGNKLGICVDVTNKYIAREYLPTEIDRNFFNRSCRGNKCLYEYGKIWYEFKIQSLNDLKANEFRLPGGSNLFEDVHNKAGKYKTPSLLALPNDCSVVTYYNTRDEARHAPSGLCKLTYGTNNPEVKKLHKYTIKPPHKRRNEINFIINNYFKDLEFSQKGISLSNTPYLIPSRYFNFPDLKFGNKKRLSTKNRTNSIRTTIEEYGRKKRELLYSEDAGLYNKEKILDRQYILLPKSISKTYGPQFINDIKLMFQRLYTHDSDLIYSPDVLYYNDSVQKNVYRLGQEIIKTVEENQIPFGFGLVMIPIIKSKYSSKEDELANLVMKELRDRDLYVSVIHTRILKDSYNIHTDSNGKLNCKIISDNKMLKKYKGYLQNVILNKILITNNYKPFILGTLLSADLIIGIDVKNETAGFTAINKTSDIIFFDNSQSQNKEQLGKNEVRSKIYQIINNEKDFHNIENIVIHRQGKIFPPEKEGINLALKQLAEKDIISPNFNCTFVELRTTSRIPYRQFFIKTNASNYGESVYNPRIGSYFILSDEEGYLCNTGFPYYHKGTTNPLHILKEGPLNINLVLKDVFYTSNLTWTKIDYCSRLPITVKLNDIRLREIAGEYDQDALIYEIEV